MCCITAMRFSTSTPAHAYWCGDGGRRRDDLLASQSAGAAREVAVHVEMSNSESKASEVVKVLTNELVKRVGEEDCEERRPRLRRRPTSRVTLASARAVTKSAIRLTGAGARTRETTAATVVSSAPTRSNGTNL